MELSIFQALMLESALDCEFDPSILNASFYLRRRHIVSQAVSLYRSVQSGRFHSYQKNRNDIRSFEDVNYCESGIFDWIEQILAYEEKFEALFLKRSRPIHMFYEDLQEDPLGQLVNMAKRIGVKPPTHLPATTLQPMQDGRSLEWTTRAQKSMPDALKRQLDKRSKKLGAPKARAQAGSNDLTYSEFRQMDFVS